MFDNLPSIEAEVEKIRSEARLLKRGVDEGANVSATVVMEMVHWPAEHVAECEYLFRNPARRSIFGIESKGGVHADVEEPHSIVVVSQRPRIYSRTGFTS